MSLFLRKIVTPGICLLLWAMAFSSAPGLTAEESGAPQPVSLPDAPTAAQQSSEPASSQPAPSWQQKPRRFLSDLTKFGPRLGDLKTVELSQNVVPLSAGEKIKLSMLEQIEPYAFASDVLVAGYSHLVNGDPKYGSDSGAFGQRLGATVIRHASQGIFSDGLAAAAFHQDPRYFRMGSGRFDHRLYYALRRTWMTRSDSGSSEINYSMFVGNAAGAALTAAYYPAQSAKIDRIAVGYGWSIFGSFLGNEYHEFSPDLIHMVFHSKEKTAPTAGSGAGGK